MRILLALLLALPAFATDPQYNKPPPGSVESSSDAISTAYGGEVGDTTATGGNLTYTSRRAANPPSAPAQYSSNPCVVPKGTFGIGFIRFGASGARAGKVDKGCEDREWVRLAPTPEHGRVRWCFDPDNAEAFGGKDECIRYGVSVTSSDEIETLRHEIASLKDLRAEIAAERARVDALKAQQAKVARQQQAAQKAASERRARRVALAEELAAKYE